MTTHPTPLPSVKEQKVRRLFEKYVVPSYGRMPVTFVKGSGNRLWDINEKSYLDFGGGIAVDSLGHAHPALTRALAKQARTLMHVSNLYYHETQGKLARKLVNLMGPGKIFFCNSGAEANEGLYKLARLAANSGENAPKERKFEIITALGSFHGRTMAGIAATGQEKIKKGFEPLTPGFVHVPFNDLEAVEKALTPQTAAVLIEGIQGEIGIIPAKADYLLGLRQLCDKHGILLMIDAVQCGFWRTGRFQSYEKILEGHPHGHRFVPDAVSMAKSMGGGFPIGCFWVRKKYQDTFQPGMHGTTYGGSPLACAATLSVIKTIEKEKLVENINTNGEYLLGKLRGLIGSSALSAVRGHGFLIGVDLNTEARPVIEAFLDKGLIVIPSGTNRFRLLPAYQTTREEIDEALAIITSVLQTGL